MTIYDLLDCKLETLIYITENIELYYNSYKIRNKIKNKIRWIDAPNNELKSIQKKILYKILYLLKPHPAAVGFIRKKNIINGASKHINKKIIFNTDVKDFFYSVNYYNICKIFYATMNILTKKYDNFIWSSEDVTILLKLVTLKKHIPQGAVTSPAISNLVCRKMDADFTRIAKSHELIYTRYADDMTFSGNIINKYKLKKDILEILSLNNFKMNYKKTYVMTSNKRQCVTGVVVNKRLSVPRYVWRNLKAEIHNYVRDNISITEEKKEKLKGKIVWIGQFRPELKTLLLKELGKVKLKN